MRGIVIVGNQPSAAAVAVKSFAKSGEGELSELLLLATEEIRARRVNERLQTYFASELPKLAIVEQTVASRVPASAQRLLPLAGNAVAEWLTQPGDRVVFFADPGLKALTLNAVVALPEDALIVHTDPRRLYVRDRQDGRELIREHPVEDLGLDKLLDLFGISHEMDARRVPQRLNNLIAEHDLHDSIAVGLVLQVPGGESVLPLAYEKGGYLYGLVYVEGTGATARNAVRDTQAQRRSFSPLRPEICAVAADDLARARGLEVQLQTIDGNPLGLQFWLDRRASPPGYACVSVRHAAPPDSPVRGSGADDSGPPSLTVWIGLDPSATLNSIYTHRPKRAYVLYDQTTPLAVLRAERMRSLAAQLPVDEVLFLASDTLGSGVLEHLPEGTCVDTTPGRVSQAIPLLDLPDAEIWQQEGDRGVALEPATGRTTPLRAAPISVQAATIGGPLRHEGVDPTGFREEGLRFFSSLTRVLRAARDEGVCRRFSPLPQVRCRAGRVTIRHAATRDPQTVTVTVTEHGLPEQNFSWELARTETGHWFEDLVAARLLVAEAVTDARIGVKWTWPDEIRKELEKKHAGDPFKDEIDVIAQSGHSFCVVSCKTGTHEAEREIGHIAALADSAMGRFCLPVFACPKPLPAALGAEKKWPNVVILDLDILSDDYSLRDELKSGWARLGTRG